MRRAPRHCLLALLWLVAVVVDHPIDAAAHAVVTRATLRDAIIPAGKASETTLEFNGAIEAKLAKVTLVDDGGTERALELVPGGHPPNVLVVSLPPLAPGHYALRYKVLAADGHVTESVLRFRVAAPE
ncbi:MAG TPA: copper resistance CopC family protein [Candidatus Limnocylindria bacterium]|nr:copper resistance CopC family protein [Candidatus Limnocylindria bacterium]